MLYPFLFGHDEHKHYNTVQYLAEPENKTWEITEAKPEIDKTKTDSYNFSEEIEKTAQATGYDNVRWKIHDSIPLSGGWMGQNEEEIIAMGWSRLNKIYPPSIIGKSRLYHLLASGIESFLAENDILVRFYAVRIFSVFIGMVCILLFYFISKISGFSQKASLLIAAIIVFQPGFAATSSFVNYDILLTLVFSLFTLGMVLAIKRSAEWLSVAIMAAAVILGILAKGSALVLIPAFSILSIYFLWKKIKNKKMVIIYSVVLLVIISSSLFIFHQKYNLNAIISLSKNNPSGAVISSLDKYLLESFTSGRMELTSVIYWSNYRWTNGALSEKITYAIWAAEALAALGVIIFLFYPRQPDFLPEKRVIIFMLILLLALQIGIRFYDWKVFYSGRGFDLGTVGRYFIPNIISHFIVLFAGMGAILRKSGYFENFLKIVLIAMIAMAFHSIFNVIIPSFYF